MKIRLEGWRFMPHSYSLVLCAHAADLAARPGIDLTMVDWPVHPDLHWDGKPALPLPADERVIRAIPDAMGEDVDAVYRSTVPVDLSDENAGRMLIHLTADNGTIADGMMVGERPLVDWLQHSPAHFATPSDWSKAGLIRSGVPEERIHLVPHGVDARLFNPDTRAGRGALLESFKIPEDAFVFLNVGSMSRRKGIDLLVKAFKAVWQDYPHAWLVLKGCDGIFRSKTRTAGHIRGATGGTTKTTFERQIRYLGPTLSSYGVAQLYGAADCYVTPYRAEGFNLPALEAIASGCPLIHTHGGPTEDFAPASAIGLRSIIGEDAEAVGGLALDPDLDHLIEMMRFAIENGEARKRAAAMEGPEIATQWTWAKATDALLKALQP